MKPLISYYGGKGRIATRIVEQIAKIPHKIYAEPFCGGCAVLFAKPKPTPSNHHHYREAINDTNELVVNLYRVAREQPETLKHWLEMTPYSRVEHKKAVAICQGREQASDIQKAWALYVNAQMSFSNTLDRGWSVAKECHNHAKTWDVKKERLETAIARLSAVHIDCQDALGFIDQWDHPDTLFYCDPPYPAANQGHYSGYTLDDFKALCEKLDGIQGSYILSCYPQGDVMPSSAQTQIEIATTMCASRDKAVDKARTEVLWLCDRNPIKNKQQLDLFVA